MRVVYGSAANSSEFGFHARLRCSCGIRCKTSCGASAIEARLAVTAAHCVVHQGRARPASSCDLTFDSRPGSSYPVRQIVVPVAYMSTVASFGVHTPNYDVAFLQLVLPAPQIAPLGDASVGELARVIGYGQTELEPHSERLRQGLVTITSSNEIVTRAIGACQAGDTQCVDACQGDSGSPLLNQQNEVIAVVSSGSKPCGVSTNYPGYYANVRNLYEEFRAQITPTARQSKAAFRRLLLICVICAGLTMNTVFVL